MKIFRPICHKIKLIQKLKKYEVFLINKSQYLGKRPRCAKYNIVYNSYFDMLTGDFSLAALRESHWRRK